MDDNAITTQLPIKVPHQTSSQHQVQIAMAQHARILASIIKELNTARASKALSDETFAVIGRLDNKLQHWRNSLPSFIQLEMLPCGTGLPEGVMIEHCLHLKLSYYATLIQIHSFVMTPWNEFFYGTLTPPSIQHQDQVCKSACIVAEASRNIIGQLRHLSISPETSKS